MFGSTKRDQNRHLYVDVDQGHVLLGVEEQLLPDELLQGGHPLPPPVSAAHAAHAAAAAAPSAHAPDVLVLLHLLAEAEQVGVVGGRVPVPAGADPLLVDVGEVAAN